MEYRVGFDLLLRDVLGNKTYQQISSVPDNWKDGTFEEFDHSSIEDYIKVEKPSAMLLIPYDNPTGQLLKRNDLIKIAKL